MNSELYVIKTNIQIAKPSHEVFEAIVNPEKMSNYFIASSTGPLEEGKTVYWTFPEFNDSSPVRGGKIVQNATISFYWNIGVQEMLVEITLIPRNNGNDTQVTIREKCVEGEPDINWLKGNTEGWANFLACLKAHLEYNINLRKGAFDFIRS